MLNLKTKIIDVRSLKPGELPEVLSQLANHEGTVVRQIIILKIDATKGFDAGWIDFRDKKVVDVKIKLLVYYGDHKIGVKNLALNNHKLDPKKIFYVNQEIMEMYL